MRSVAGMTMVSRVLVFARDVLMATALGTGLVADAFFLAWMLPNLARRLFGEGAFAAALVPVFVEAREQGEHAEGRRLVNAATTRLAVALLVVIVVLELACALARSSWGHGLADDLGLGRRALVRIDLALSLAQLLLPYLGFICLSGVLGGALNALDRFAVPAAAPVVLNLVWIGAVGAGWALFAGELPRVRLLALALVGAGVVQLLMHAAAMSRAGVPLRPTLQADPRRLARVRGLFFSLALGLALFQLNALLDGLIAYAFVPAGGVSALYYANRLVQLPIGVLGVALATVVFPELARRAKRGDLGGMGQILDRGLGVGVFVSLPAAVGLAVLAEPLVRTLFERGAFDEASVRRTARVLLFLSPAVVTACVTPVITRAFYAEEQTRLPVVVGAVCVAVNLALNVALVGPLHEAGLALATAVSQTLNLVLQAVFSRRRRLGRGDRPATAATALAVARCAALSALMAGGAWAVYRYAPGPEPLRVAGAIACGVAVYGGLSWALGVSELRLVLDRRRRA